MADVALIGRSAIEWQRTCQCVAFGVRSLAMESVSHNESGYTYRLIDRGYECSHCGKPYCLSVDPQKVAVISGVSGGRA